MRIFTRIFTITSVKMKEQNTATGYKAAKVLDFEKNQTKGKQGLYNN